MTNIDSVLQKIASGDFTSWQGLPPGIKPTDINTVFTEERAARSYQLSGRKLTQTGYKTSGQDHTVYMWFDKDTLALIRMYRPNLKGSIKSLIESLGNPEMKIEHEQGFTYPLTTQWVYARKGITLFVNDHSKSLIGYPEDFVEAVALYQPATAEEYKHNLGGTEINRIRKRWDR